MDINKEKDKNKDVFSPYLKSFQTFLSSLPLSVDNRRDNGDTSQTDQNEN